MRQTRREFLRGAIGWGGLVLAGSWKLAAGDDGQSVRRALRFFERKQEEDGAWRSDRYAAFRDGDALTPVILWALQGLRAGAADEMVVRGRRWLERLTDERSASAEPWVGLHYPLFTASYAARVLAASGDAPRAARWADVIERLRLSPALGWPVDDPACGAWSDAPEPPRYVRPVPDMRAPNLSATVLALEALVAAGRANRVPAARPFIESCQNFSSAGGDPFDDGGFFFAPDDPIRNKAGVAGRDAHGRLRFHSYGSATCDGLLALTACGVSIDHPRWQAGAEWLRRQKAGRAHSGQWAQGRETARASLDFYYAQGLAAVLEKLQPAADWAAARRRALGDGLRERQTADGSWQGDAAESCEDEPFLATAFALRAYHPTAAPRLRSARA